MAASTLDGVSQSQRLALALGLNLALVAALVIVGLTAHSLGVLAAGHFTAVLRRLREGGFVDPAGRPTRHLRQQPDDAPELRAA